MKKREYAVYDANGRFVCICLSEMEADYQALCYNGFYQVVHR